MSITVVDLFAESSVREHGRRSKRTLKTPISRDACERNDGQQDPQSPYAGSRESTHVRVEPRYDDHDASQEKMENAATPGCPLKCLLLVLRFGFVSGSSRSGQRERRLGH